MDLILIYLLSQFQDIHSPDKHSDYDIVSGFLKIFITHIMKTWRKVCSYLKGDFETMSKDALRYAKESTSKATQMLDQYRRTVIR